ncbi:MAG TPA: contractile injection system protein, VgrG/Pvc8 family [Candidatus Binataceae bacterium]|nr:contractile injection system protein, VgrG/Pvc8 family [Candidatus Binataceae bacterium]
MASALAYPVRTPQWILSYQGVNITADISTMVLSVTYTDRLGGEAGEIELEIEDHAKRWQGPWYPALGDVVSLAIGYRGEAMLPCGDFQVDDLELSGPPDVFRLRCLSAYITPAMRTPNTVPFENYTVMGIAQAIAAKYQLGVVGAPGLDDIEYARITQKQETDLAFLRRLANEHNYEFTVAGTQLVFYARGDLESAAPVATIVRSDVEQFSFRNRTRTIYQGAQVSYQNPDNKSVITRNAAATTPVAPTDTLKIVSRCENGQQAAIKAQAALHFHNMVATEAWVSGPGMTALAAGNTIALSGWGVMDSTYLIETARHRLSRSRGYTTEVEVRSVS